MAKTALTVRLQLDGARETLKAFRDLPKDATVELRDAALELSGDLADSAVQAAEADSSPQSKLVAKTVKARRDRIPSVQAGGTRRLGRHRVPAYKLLFGAEFGSNRFTQFGHPHRGRQGYWFFPVVEREQRAISKAWNDAADDVIRRWSRGG